MVSWSQLVPVSVTWVGRYKITIYDKALYDQSKLDYPDYPDHGDVAVFQASSNRSKPMFAKKKPTARYNWIVRPEQPLGNLAQEKGSIA